MNDYFPLAHPQKRIIVNQQIFPESKFAYMYGRVQIEGQTVVVLSEAINAAISYFDCLRIRFARNDSQTEQFISAIKREDIETRRADFDYSGELFDIFNGKLYKFFIVEGDGNPSGYFFIFHHAIVDAYTITLIVRFISDYLCGNAHPQPCSFRDFVIAEQEYLKSGEFNSDNEFFLKRLRDSLSFKYIAEFDLRCERIEHSFSGDESKMLLSYCKKREVSVFKLVYAALFLLLYEQDGKTVQTVSTTHHNRNTDELSRTGGMLAATVPVVQEIDLSAAFDEFLSIVSSNISECLKRRRFPIDMSPALKGSFDLDITGVMLNSIPFGDGSAISRFSPNEDISHLNFKLNPHSRPKGSDIVIALDYRKSRYSSKDAAKILDRLADIVQKFALNDGVAISSIIAPIDDIVTIIEKTAAGNPDKIALVDDKNELTYGQLAERVNAVSCALVEAGHVVGVANERSVWYPVAALGALKAGKAFVPLDYELPALRLENIIRQTRVETILTFSNGDYNKSGVGTIDIRELESVEANTITRVGELAYIIFTSGSSGAPKGVMVGRFGLHSLLKSLKSRYGIQDNQRFSAFCDFSFDVSIAEIFLPLYTSSTLFITNEAQRRDLGLLDSFLRTNKIDHVFLPTKIGEMFIQNFPDCPIKNLTIAGEKMNYYQKTRYQVYNGYGPTEFTVLSHVGRVAEPDGRYSIGQPLDGVSDMILDDGGKPSNIGELVLTGVQAALGYLNDYKLTAERFSSRHAFRTADKVERDDDGKIYFISRMDRQIKHNGYRIELGEIENAANGSALTNASACKYNGKEIILTVVPGENYNKEALSRFLLERLPRYAVPRRIIEVDDIPKAKGGKTDYSIGVPRKVPTTATEKKLLRVYSGYAKVAGVADNIFADGIDSLDILQIMLEIERKFRFRIHFSDFIIHPTVREQAALIENRANHECVAMLREGAGVPLVLIFDLSRDIISYWRLLGALSPGYPVIGVSSGAIPRNASLEDYARGLTEKLKERCNFESFDLAGYSSGGIIALEMGKNLGAKARHIFLIDTPNYAVYPRLLNLRFVIGNLFTILTAYGAKGFAAYLRRCLSDLAHLKTLFGEGNKLVKMIREYRPENIPPSVALLATADMAKRADSKLGWQAFDEIDIVETLCGGHISVMKKGVSKIAKTLENRRESCGS